MELCSAFVQISPIMRLRKHRLSPAEIVLLRDLHRDCEFTELCNLDDVTRSNSSELQRLRLQYNPGIVEKLFPGATPAVPTTFADIGLEVASTRLPVEPPMTSMPTYEDATELNT